MLIVEKIAVILLRLFYKPIINLKMIRDSLGAIKLEVTASSESGYEISQLVSMVTRE